MMNKNPPPTLPKVSLVTPSLNQGQFIEATIQSVLSQGYPNLEYLIIDGGSTDNTLSVLHSHSDRLTWVSERDTGQTNAINKGLSMASGEILGYLNADDLLLPGALSNIADLFVRSPDVMWATGQCRIIDEQDREIRGLVTAYKNLLLHFRNRSLLLITDYISQPATFWRADVYRNLGPLDEKLHYAMDYEYWLRLYSKYALNYIPQELAAFRIHSGSKNTNAGHQDVYVQEEQSVIQQYTASRFIQSLHNIHRWFMTTTYALINRKA